MNQREKEQYLREYALHKAAGKPFFPYAVAKDSIMAAIVVAAIVVMSLLFGAELGPKADPTTTTYTPRPEWYFFFLFELLRLFQNPDLLLFATIIIPTLFMVVLIGMPFIDRGRERRLSRRPIAVGVAGAMAVLLLSLTWYGSKAPGAAAAGTTTLAFTANLPCASCHQMKAASGWNGNVGPNLDSAQPTYALAIDRVTNGKGVMPAFKGTYSDAKIKCIATFVATESRGGTDDAKLGGSAASPTVACKGIQ